MPADCAMSFELPPATPNMRNATTEWAFISADLQTSEVPTRPKEQRVRTRTERSRDLDTHPVDARLVRHWLGEEDRLDGGLVNGGPELHELGLWTSQAGAVGHNLPGRAGSVLVILRPLFSDGRPEDRGGSPVSRRR
jgi:hypothetical protein